MSPESSFENSLDLRYSLSKSILSGSLHKIDDSNHKSPSTESLIVAKIEETGTGNKIKQDRIHITDEIFGKDELLSRFDLDPNLKLPIKSPILSMSNDLVSVVSALTFDYANLETYTVKNLDVPEIGKSVSAYKQPQEQKKRDQNELSRQGPRKSERINAVHRKVIQLQRENAELQETNRQLVTQTKLRSGKEKQDELNAFRLNIIAEKVFDIQAENQSLQAENENLLLYIGDLESKQATTFDSNKIRGSDNEQKKPMMCEIVANSTSCEKEQLGLKEKVAELDFKNSQQRLRIEELEHALKEKNVCETNLEQHVELLNDEMITLRQNHDDEREDFQDAYNELKGEASQVVDWLKKQLTDYQSKYRAEEIAKAREDNDLESLTKSERESLVAEIEEERQNWIEDLGGSPSRLDFVIPSRSEELELSIIRGSDSIGGSTLTDPVSPI